MAIRFITGVPGGGKTYLAVKHLVDTYFDWQKELNDWTLKPEFDGLTIITNIDEFELDHKNLGEALRLSKLDIKKFFTVEYQQKLLKKYPRIVYVIDEAQRLFDSRFYDKEVFYFFEYHRHLGIDIYLITQNRRKISRDITDLVELEYRAVKRSLSIMGELKYLVLSENQIIDRKMIRPQKRIYQLYKSMTAKETENIRNPLKKYLVAIMVLMVLSVYGFKKTFFSPKPENIQAQSHESAQVAHAAPAGTSTAWPTLHGKAEPTEVKEDLEIVQASFIIQGTHLLVYDPVTNRLIPAESFPHKLEIRRFKNTLYVTAFIPRRLMPEQTPQPEAEEAPRLSL